MSSIHKGTQDLYNWALVIINMVWWITLTVVSFRLQSENVAETCTSIIVQAGGMTFFWNGLGPVIHVEQLLNSNLPNYSYSISSSCHVGGISSGETMCHPTVLVLWRSGFRDMRETLPCSGHSHIHQISIQLSNCRTEFKEASTNLIHNHLMSQNLTSSSSAWYQIPNNTFRGVNAKKNYHII